MEYSDIIVECTFTVSVLAFAVSAVTEATKNLPFLKKIPTQIQVLVLSFIATEGGYIGYSLSVGKPITFFCITAAFFCSFIVALVAENGWNSVTNLYKRVSRNGKE